MTDRAHQLHAVQPPPAQSSSGGNGNGHDLHGRVSSLEAHLQHLATKEDIRRLETLMAQRESAMLRWLIVIAGTAVITLAVALIRTFLS